MKKKIIAALCAVMVLQTACVDAEYREDDLKNAVNNAIEWKERNDNPFYGIGTKDADLYIMSMKRLGKEYDYNSYLAGLDGIAAGYGAEHNASDMQRTVLATVASGGDARNVGGRDLVADGIYYRNNVAPIDKEGVDGYSWGLIALDSGVYETPEWALTNRNDIISGILSYQNTNGSFDDSVYSTASAVIALAPYYETSGAYTVTQNQTGLTVDISPMEAIDTAINYLADEQTNYGDFGDLKSTAMTVIALDSVGIDADGDRRFEAKKGNALDGLMLYQMKDGGFSSDLKGSDGEATSFALCALASHLRVLQGKSSFFRFEVNDSVAFDKPVQSPSSNGGTSSGSTSAGTTKPNATTRPAATAKPKSATRPRASIAPKASSNPAATMRPTRTTTPQSSAKPGSTSKPKATKRPALVGPVEMAGPMPTDSGSSLANGNSNAPDKSSGTAALAIVFTVLLLAAAGIAVVFALAKCNKISENNPIAKFIPFIKKKKKKLYKAKSHRKTEERRRFEHRGKYKQRKKYR